MIVFSSPSSKSSLSKNNSEAKVVADATTAEIPAVQPTAEPTAIPDNFKVGQVIQMKDYQLTVNSVKKANAMGYSTPDKGKEFITVNLTIQNKGEKEVSYNPLDFKIQDSDGNQTSETYVTIENKLHYGSLASGGKVTGAIVFEVPKADTNLKLIYQPNVWLDNQRITVDLQ
jgi:hypothetical protein